MTLSSVGKDVALQLRVMWLMNVSRVANLQRLRVDLTFYLQS